jgi:excinuclease ABC subunit A
VRLTSALSEEKRLAAQRLAGGVMARVRQLRELGLGYLSLDRATPTLSAGELQRLRLATQLSSLLFGVLYVLDEPSAGLHPADSQALYDALDRLRDGGNSVFVVEHDLDLMRRAQWLVDVGRRRASTAGACSTAASPTACAASRTRAPRGTCSTRCLRLPAGNAAPTAGWS